MIRNHVPLQKNAFLSGFFEEKLVWSQVSPRYRQKDELIHTQFGVQVSDARVLDNEHKNGHRNPGLNIEKNTNPNIASPTMRTCNVPYNVEFGHPPPFTFEINKADVGTAAHFFATFGWYLSVLFLKVGKSTSLSLSTRNIKNALSTRKIHASLVVGRSEIVRSWNLSLKVRTFVPCHSTRH